MPRIFSPQDETHIPCLLEPEQEDRDPIRARYEHVDGYDLEVQSEETIEECDDNEISWVQRTYGSIREAVTSVFDTAYDAAADRLPFLDGTREEKRFVGSLVAGLPAYVGGGIAGAEAASYLFDSKTLVTGVSMATAYVGGILPLTAVYFSDRSGRFVDEEGIDYTAIGKRFLQMQVSLGASKAVYGVTKAATMYGLLSAGSPPSVASVGSDIIASPFYYLTAPEPARQMGVLAGEDEYIEEVDISTYAVDDLQYENLADQDDVTLLPPETA